MIPCVMRCLSVGICPFFSSTEEGATVSVREVIEHLEDCRNLSETVELVQQHTRQLAKRQGTWVRSLSECRPVAVSEPLAAAEAAARIAAVM